MKINKRYRNNININYIYTLFSSLDLTRGIWMIYIASKGIGLAKLGILEAVFHVTSFLMEIPTGMVADVLGRKMSRLIGRIFSIISTVIMIYSQSFYGFLIAFIICALSYNLESGAGTALIYDSMKANGEEDGFIKVNGRIEMMFQIASVIALLLGGYLANIDYFYSYIVTLIFSIVSLIITFTFEEVVVEKKDNEEKNPIKIFKKQLKDSTRAFMDNKKIGMLMVFAEIISAFCTSLFFYLQNYWSMNGLTEFNIGVIFAVSSLVCAITGVFAHKLENRLKEKGILMYLPIIFVLCMIGVAYTKYTYIFFIMMNVIEGIIFIVIGSYVNKLIESEVRATILSFQSMIFSFFMIFVFPMIGALGDLVSLNFAFKIMLYIFVILVIGNTILLKNIEKKKNKIDMDI